jgi:isoleucyl-tRNA synthetase
LRLADPQMRAEAGRMRDELRYLFIVSQVVLFDAPPSGELPEIRVLPAEGGKCERCWNYSPQVGQFPEHPTLCERCEPVVSGVYAGK